MTRLIIVIFSIAICVLNTIDAQVSFTVNAPGRIPAGDKFPVTFVLKNAEASASTLKVPQINGCTLLYGPTTARSQSYQIYNGQTMASSTVEFTYYYRADKEGSYTIGSASIVADGKKLTTQPVTLTIAPAPTQSQGQSGSRQPVSVDDITTQDAGRPIGANDVFIRISTSRASTYEQEAIECTIKLYTKYSIVEFMPITQPTFNGFLVDDLPIQASLNARETYNGQEYMTAVIKKCILFPQKSGKLTIVSGAYDLKAVQYDQVNMGFYVVSQPQTRKIRVNSNSASVDVKPLPTPQPAGFSGAVGNYTADVQMSTTSFRTNEPATLTYTITGSGNIKYLADPEVDFPSEFELYTPQHSVDAKVENNNVKGISRTEFTFIPKEVGTFNVNVPDFIYFDPQRKEYVTIKTPSYDVKILKGVSNSSGEKQDIAAKNTDILYIKTGSLNLSQNRTYIISESWYWIIYLALISILAGLLVYSARSGRRAANVALLRQSKANKVARKRLKAARKYMSNHDSEKFYAETLRALWGYLSDKLSIPAAELSRTTIAEQLSDRGASDELCGTIISILDTCEMARYTPSGSQSQIAAVYDQATDAINELEKTKIVKKTSK